MFKYIQDTFHWQGILISVIGNLIIVLTVGYIPALGILVLITGYNTSFKDTPQEAQND